MNNNIKTYVAFFTVLINKKLRYKIKSMKNNLKSKKRTLEFYLKLNKLNVSLF